MGGWEGVGGLEGIAELYGNKMVGRCMGGYYRKLKPADTEPSYTLASDLGLKEHHPILSMLGGHICRTEREREIDRSIYYSQFTFYKDWWQFFLWYISAQRATIHS